MYIWNQGLLLKSEVLNSSELSLEASEKTHGAVPSSHSFLSLALSGGLEMPNLGLQSMYHTGGRTRATDKKDRRAQVKQYGHSAGKEQAYGKEIWKKGMSL